MRPDLSSLGQRILPRPGEDNHDNLQDLLGRLENSRPEGDGYRASCPVAGHGKGRGDRDPSLSVKVGQAGALLLKCHGGCRTEDVVASVGLTMRDLFTDRRPAKKNGHHPQGTYRGPSATWEIRDEDGNVQAIHERHERPDGSKDCFWKLPGVRKYGLGGRKLATLPLYRSEEARSWPSDVPVVVTEGEKAADALAELYPYVLGTVTGASGTPGPEALGPLKGRSAVLWADADEPGKAHMRRLAASLEGIAEEVRVYEPEMKPGGDAADHEAVLGFDLRSLVEDWKKAPLASRPVATVEQADDGRGMQGRVLLGELLRGGIEPTPQLIEGLVYEGRIHAIAGPGGSGKTLIAEWIAHEVMKMGQPVLYLDAENGPKLIAERLQEMGADLDDLDAFFHYFPADLTLATESIVALMETVEEVQPALVVFDSFADFLAMSDLDENSNKDCRLWSLRVAKVLKEMGVASLILDHVPKGATGPRGAGSKRDVVDVLWNLEVTQPFDRERTGELQIKHDKDRECWLPKIVRFSIGGGVFARSAGTIVDPDEEQSLTGSASDLYDALRKAGEEGMRWTDLLTVVGNSKGNLSRGLAELLAHGLIEKRGARYHLKELPVPPGTSRGTTSEGEVPYGTNDGTTWGESGTTPGPGGTTPLVPLSGGTSVPVTVPVTVPENPIYKPVPDGTARYQKGTTVPSGTGESEDGTRGTHPFRGGTSVPSDAPAQGWDSERVERLVEQGMGREWIEGDPTGIEPRGEP